VTLYHIFSLLRPEVTRVGFDFLLQISNCDNPTSALPSVIIWSLLDRNPRCFIPAMDQPVSEHDGFRLPYRFISDHSSYPDVSMVTT